MLKALINENLTQIFDFFKAKIEKNNYFYLLLFFVIINDNNKNKIRNNVINQIIEIEGEQQNIRELMV